MQIQCPSCSQSLELDDAELAGLTADAEIACPGCATPILIHPEAAEALPSSPGWKPPSLRNVSPAPRKPAAVSAAQAHRGLNRKLLLLGAAALLVLGGIGAVLISRRSGNVHHTTQNITNEIIRNKFFTDLIASGATTEKELEAISEIRPHGEGFIGISKEKVTWEEARELAWNTGSEILPFEDREGRTRSELARFLAETFPGLLGETSWIQDRGDPKMIDSPDLLTVTTLERPRRALVTWQPGNPYMKNKSWVRLAKVEPELPRTFDADKGEWLQLWIQYNHIGPKPVRIWATPYLGGEMPEGFFSSGSDLIEAGSGTVQRGFGFRMAGEVDEVRIELADGGTKEPLVTVNVPLHAIWRSSQDVELISVKAPALLSPDKEITIPADAGERFTIELTARYNTPRPTKLASNLLMEQANILPQEFLAELKANHSTTWHFDTGSRPGYGSVNGRGTITYDLTGYAPREPGTYTFDFNLGLFDNNTWATQVMKIHKVTLNVTEP